MNADTSRELVIFTEVAGLALEDRPAHLSRACGGDEILRGKVQALLQAHDRAGTFLEEPAGGGGAAETTPATHLEQPGDRIGRYMLLRQIGEGGCGIVYLAEQEEPVHRLVALKVIKPGMDTKSVIARFQAERQALALMDHPNVAKLFDAGTTAAGRPYFVMEMIEGIKVTDYCDQSGLTVKERLGLFVQICQGLQHAHQKGVIHRDIKPSNILVRRTTEGAAVPVIIDFGIAKPTANQRLTEETFFTVFDLLIGTPAYMSPEQAALTGADVDTCSDIYSLGVLLYELLTGETPFDTGKLAKSGLTEMIRVIREQEPDLPSAKLSGMPAIKIRDMAQRRKAEPFKLVREIRGDLDCIVMKALEKDRLRRYATANGLAMDVERFLSNETIVARPPSRVYRFQKLVVRHKFVFGGIAVITAVLLTSLIIVSVSLAKERQLRRDADAASATSRQVTKFLEDMLNRAGPATACGRDTTMFQEILDQTAESLGKEMNVQPAVEAELWDLMGKLYGQIGGNTKRGEKMERTALAIRERQFGSNSLETAASLNDLGLELMAQHKLPEAEKEHAQALAIRSRLLGKENADTATSLNDLGAVYRDEGKLEEAETMTREALGVRLRRFGTNHLDVADSFRNLSMVLGAENKWAEAEALARKALLIRSNVLGAEHPWVASSLDDVAWAANGRGNYAEAEKLEGQALVMRQKLLKTSHPDISRTLNALGQVLGNRGDLAASDAVLKAVLSIQRQLLGDNDQSTLETYSALANVLKSEGKWAEAEKISREALPLWRKRGGIEEQQSMYTLRSLGLAFEAEHKWPEAEAVDREALSVSQKKGDEDPEAVVDLERLTRMMTNEKKSAEAEHLLNKALTPKFMAQPASADLVIDRLNILGRQGKWREAAADATVALEDQPADHYRYHTLATLLAAMHDGPDYEHVCKELVAKFTNPTNLPANPYVAERITQDCLLLPDSGVDLQLTDKLADVAVTLGSGEASLPYFLACKAMSAYRMGSFREATNWAGKAASNPTAEAPAKAKALAILAMADWQLGQIDAARAALAGGNEAAPILSADPNSRDAGESWMALLIARISLDEAATLIHSDSAANSNLGGP